MDYYDQHLHTYLSFDSQERFENYLIDSPQYFVTTDQFDLKNPYTNYNDDIPDYKELCKKMNKLEERYDTKFLKGIEIGVVPGQEEKILSYLNQHPYDLKLEIGRASCRERV